jgi:tetratricopeptide (TPR) repeat protein
LTPFPYSLGQYEKAIEHYNQALAISREIGDRQGEGNRLGNLGMISDFYNTRVTTIKIPEI